MASMRPWASAMPTSPTAPPECILTTMEPAPTKTKTKVPTSSARQGLRLFIVVRRGVDEPDGRLSHKARIRRFVTHE